MNSKLNNFIDEGVASVKSTVETVQKIADITLLTPPPLVSNNLSIQYTLSAILLVILVSIALYLTYHILSWLWNNTKGTAKLIFNLVVIINAKKIYYSVHRR